MKNTLLALLGFILLSTALAATAQQPSDFQYDVVGGGITIYRYIGFGGAVTIPNTIAGLPVTAIGYNAFDDNPNLTEVTIPASVNRIADGSFANCDNLVAINVNAANAVYSSLNGVVFEENQTRLFRYPGGKAGSYLIPGSVTTIGDYAFLFCTGLTSVTIPSSVSDLGLDAFRDCTSLSAITVDALNSVCGSVDGILFNKSQTALIQYPSRKAGSSYTIPNSVTTIGNSAFYYCTSLTSVTIPNSVGIIGESAFHDCASLTRVYFQGNAPELLLCGCDAFFGANNAIVYYLPGTTGWNPTFAGRPTVLWNPRVQTGDASFGVRTNRFGFNITGTTNIPLVVEASTTLAHGSWFPLQSLNLTNGAFYFSDPQWTNCSARFYRLRSP